MADGSTTATSGRFSSEHQPAAWETRRRPGGTARTPCPHCAAALTTRSSMQLTPTVREIRLQCSDLECSASYVATLSIDRMIAPSHRPNPKVRLPLSPPRAARAANDDIPAAAN